jgi:hypothetical protein
MESEITVQLRNFDQGTGTPADAQEAILRAGTNPWILVSPELEHILYGWDSSKPLGEVLDRPIYRGVTTGLNEAFVIDQLTRDRLVQEDPSSADIIKPFLRGEDLRPWHHKGAGLWLIFSRRGIDIESYPAIKNHLEAFRERLEPRPKDWSRSSVWPGRKAGVYRWFEIQDSVDYYKAFEQPRIHSTKVSLFPTFSLIKETTYAANTSYVLPIEDTIMVNYLLGILNSRVCEFYWRKVYAPKANGYFEIQPGELSRLPIPEASDEEREAIGALAMEITEQARARYTLHERVRRRIFSDLGTPDKKLNQKLTAWWNLDFPALRAEIKKVFKSDIPLAERDDWEDWLAGRRAEHERLTSEIVRRETELNERVYELFDLGPDEIRIIEESTKYRYGEV